MSSNNINSIHFNAANFREDLSRHGLERQSKRPSDQSIIFIAREAISSGNSKNRINNLQNQLNQLGYDHFQICLKGSNQFEIVEFDTSAFEKGIDSWAQVEGGRSYEAAKQIKSALYKNESLLLLDSFNLKSIPPELGQLSNLNILYLGRNQIENIPPEIGRLPNLTNFILYQNKIKSIPPEIGQLSNLELLHLGDNQLKSLFLEIRQLSNLRALYLDKNQIENIPFEIGHLLNLHELHIQHNSTLSDLPLSLGQCSQLTSLDNRGTNISLEKIDAIMAMCQAQRSNEALLVLPKRLEAWKTCSEKTFDLAFIEQLPQEEKGVINEWLTRLERTRDFKTEMQKELASATCSMLLSFKTSPSFKETFFVQVPLNLTQCEDRAAMSFNELYLAWELDQLGQEHSMSEKDQLHVIARGAKTVTLRYALQKQIDNQETKQRIEAEKRCTREGTQLRKNMWSIGEGVEIFLYYEIHLREQLDLLTFMKESKYAQGMGKSSWIDEKALIQEVNEYYIDEMIDMPSTLALRMKSADFSKSWETVSLKFTEEMVKLGGELEQLNTQMDKGEIKKEKGDEEKASIEQKMKAIDIAKKKEERDLTCRWINSP